MRLRVGREHNPIVRWDTALHHGLYMQTPIERPSMARFEDDGGLLARPLRGPPRGRPRREHRAAIRGGGRNGRGAIPDEVQVTFDRNGNKAFVGWLGLAPPGLVGLEVSLTGYADRPARRDG